MEPEVLRWTRHGTDFAICNFEQRTQLFSLQAIGHLVGNVVVVSILWYIMHRENERRDRGERDDRLREVEKGVFLGDDDPRWRFQT